MKEMILMLGTVASLVGLCSHASAAPRTFVKSNGSDSNPCSLIAPCRNFQAAVNAVDADGEVVALDSAGYGTLVITKAVTVLAPLGVYAGITASSGIAVQINAGSSDVVALRGLTLKGIATGEGIVFIGGAVLHVEDCVLSGFGAGGSGASIVGTIGRLYVSDTVIRDGAGAGISVTNAKATLVRTKLERLVGCGIQALDNTKVFVRDTTAFGNVYGFCSQGNPSEISIRGGTATYNSSLGVYCTGANAIVRAADMLVAHNGTGFAQQSSCVFESLGNNLVAGNTNANQGTITVVAGK